MMENIDFSKQMVEIRRWDEHKTNIIQSFGEQLQELHGAYNQGKLDLERETRSNRAMQLEMRQLEAKLQELQKCATRDTFIMVLIDGDGMIFEDELMQRGEEGGKEAANRLYSKIKEYADGNFDTLPTDCRIVARVYANIKGLSEACSRAGILDSPFMLQEFARGFNGGRVLFDFVDVPHGKDRADAKITNTFKLNLNSQHCKHIFLGGSHDNGYARLLEEYVDQSNKSKVTLLEGVPFERELAGLGLNRARFENVFRSSKIVAPGYSSYHPAIAHVPTQQQYIQPHMPSHSLTNGAVNSVQAINGGAVGGQSTMSPYQSPYQHHVMHRTSSANAAGPPAPGSWATKASTPAPPSSTPPPRTKSPAVPTIPRNKFGQRVDPPLSGERAELGQKVCNVHFLRGDCRFGDDCVHGHHAKPTKAQLDGLRFVARSTPCHYGPGCEDIKCIYGHRCPYGNDPNSKHCTRYASCKFGQEFHGIDTQVVRTTRIS